ncbi:hypothetical protein Ais01nite_41650 [Asanoa ishikariensis]|uniref:Repeat domain-containing protein n=1 Tax=Asanoa ishikariensis TaxID=137265 RepID=A0A1H3MI03_9ACTN|nr:hypothetical protein [Asanoa ishikariensis]GIF66130.1 hypothetical protein Ais01nite_41650 [Asanoa ishikariensis]SDY75978.1 hypothetical protein SAMN05421684_1405 [Asanoa ishikariensis]
MVLFNARRSLGVAAATALSVLATAAPAVAAPPDSIETPVVTTPGVAHWVGTPITFELSPGGTTLPKRYRYVVNGRTRSVVATAGSATITLTPAGRTTDLTVQAIGAGGVASPTVHRTLLSQLADPAAEHDLNGDGVADLLTVGHTDALASGLWLAAGGPKRNGRVRVPATNIGVNGVDIGSGPEAYDGAQALTGRFTGDNFQDVLVYRPEIGDTFILDGTGDGSPLDVRSGSMHYLPGGVLTDLNGNNPSQLANAYDASGNGLYYPDLIGISGDYLTYYPNANGLGNYLFTVQLDTPTPTGGTDWPNWTIASTVLPTGTAMYLWNRQTGDLYLWENLAFTDNGDMTGSLDFTAYLVATGWNTGTTPSTLQATDINTDGVPDLWSVASNGTATAYLVSDLSASGPAKIRAKAPQILS